MNTLTGKNEGQQNEINHLEEKLTEKTAELNRITEESQKFQSYAQRLEHGSLFKGLEKVNRRLIKLIELGNEKSSSDKKLKIDTSGPLENLSLFLDQLEAIANQPQKLEEEEESKLDEAEEAETIPSYNEENELRDMVNHYASEAFKQEEIVGDLQKQIKKLKKQKRKDLDRAINHTIEIAEKLNNGRIENEKLTQEISRLQSDLEKTQEKLVRVQDELANEQSRRVRDNEKSEAVIGELENQLADQGDIEKELHEQVQQLEKEKASIEANLKQVRTRKQISDGLYTKKLITDTKKQIATKDQIIDLELEVDNLTEELTTTKNELQTEQDKLQRERKERIHAENELDIVDGELDAATTENNQLKSQINHLQTELIEAGKDAIFALQEIGRLNG